MRALGHTAYHHVGVDEVDADMAPAPVAPAAVPRPVAAPRAAWMGTRDMLTTGAQALAAFHGYRRNKSIWWGVIWAMAAGVAPAITTGIAVAQGLGKSGKGS